MKRLLIGLSFIAAIGRGCGEVAVYAQEAQEPRKEPERPRQEPPRRGMLARLLAAISEEERPVRPLAGVVVPGSGLAGGVALEARRLGDSPWGVGGEGLISIRNYRHVLVRAGRLEARHGLPGLRPADSAITSMMEEGREHADGLAVFAEHRWRYLPSLSFFGYDALGSARTDFGVRRTTTDAVVQWRPPGGRVGLSGRAGLMSTTTFAGTDDSRPDTVDRFGPPLDIDRLTSTRYVTAGVGALVDHRNEATRPGGGWLAQAVVNGYHSTTGAGRSFVRMAIDARAFRSIGPKRHMLAARVVASADVAPDGGRVPFFLQQTLGGTNSLRGYTSYRLRGERLAHLTVESRWQVWRRLDVVPFVDAGSVGRSPIDQGLHGLIVSPGVGFRMKHKGRSIGRMDVGWGREGTRVSFDVGAPF